MRKLIIAVVAILLVVGAALFEIFYTTETFETLERLSRAAGESIVSSVTLKQKSEDEKANAGQASESTSALYEAANRVSNEKVAEVEAYWEKRKIGIGFFGNHTVTKSIEERITTLKTQASTKAWEDAEVSAMTLTTYCEGLKDDTHPALSNLF